MKTFLIEDFFHLPPVSKTPVVHLELRISPRIFEKIRNGPNGILRGLRKLIHEKKPEVKNLLALSLYTMSASHPSQVRMKLIFCSNKVDIRKNAGGGAGEGRERGTPSPINQL
jgi:hypothetical protein